MLDIRHETATFVSFLQIDPPQLLAGMTELGFVPTSIIGQPSSSSSSATTVIMHHSSLHRWFRVC